MPGCVGDLPAQQGGGIAGKERMLPGVHRLPQRSGAGPQVLQRRLLAALGARAHVDPIVRCDLQRLPRRFPVHAHVLPLVRQAALQGAKVPALPVEVHQVGVQIEDFHARPSCSTCTRVSSLSLSEKQVMK